MLDIKRARLPLYQLLLLCAHPILDERRQAEVRSLARSELDWQRLLSLSLIHGVFPLLYHHLHSCCYEFVPEPFQQVLQHHFHLLIARNERQKRQIAAIVQTLAGKDICAVPFKGPFLAGQLYGDGACRLSSDLDFLIDAGQALEAIEPLIGLGYQLRDFQHRKQIDIESNPFIAFVDKVDKSHIDLKWGMVAKGGNRFFITLQNHIQDLQSVPFQGVMIPQHSWEDLVLLLAVHGHYHDWCRLVWLSDIAAVKVRHPQMDWQLLRKSAKKLGLSRLLAEAFTNIDQVLDVQMPLCGRPVRRTRRWRYLALVDRSGVFSLDIDSPQQTGFFRNTLIKHLRYVAIWDRRRDRWGYLLEVVKKNTRPNILDYRVLPLPKPLHTIYYLIRPVRLLITYLPGLLHKSIVSRLAARNGRRGKSPSVLY